MEYEEPIKNIDFQLTSDQQKALNDILPPGFSLQFATKPNRRESHSKGSKKVQLEGGSYKSIQQTDFSEERPSKKKQQPNQYTNVKQQQQPPQNNNNTILTNSNIQQLNNSITNISTAQSKQPSQVSPTSIQSRDSKSRSSQRSRKSKNDKQTLDLDTLGTPSNKVKGLNAEMKKCNQILQNLKKHPYAGPFLQPVDPVELNCHDYFEVVKEPVDLSTIENQLKAGMYISPQQFAADIRKIWNNSYLYNQKGSPIYQMTVEMHHHFDKLYKDMEAPAANFAGTSSVLLLQKQVEKLSKELKELNSNKGRGTKGSKKNTKASQGKMDTQMTMTEKRNLGAQIRQLPPEHLKGVWEIVSDGNLNNQNREVLEFDIDKLPIRKTRELETYVKNKIAQLSKQKNKKKGPKGAQQAQNQIPPQAEQIPQDQMMNQYQQQNVQQPYNQQQQQFGQYNNQGMNMDMSGMNNSGNMMNQSNMYNSQQGIISQQQQQNSAEESEEQSESFISDSEDADN